MHGENRLALAIVGGLLVAKGLQRAEHAAAINARTDVLYRLHLTRRRWHRRAMGAATVLEVAAGAGLLVLGRRGGVRPDGG